MEIILCELDGLCIKIALCRMPFSYLSFKLSVTALRITFTRISTGMKYVMGFFYVSWYGYNVCQNFPSLSSKLFLEIKYNETATNTTLVIISLWHVHSCKQNKSVPT